MPIEDQPAPNVRLRSRPSSWVWWFPLGVLAVFVVLAAWHWFGVARELSFLQSVPNNAVAARFGRGLALFSASSLMMLAALIWSLGVGIRILYESIDGVPERWRRRIWAGAAVFAVAFAVLAEYVRGRTGPHILDLLRRAVQEVRVPELLPPTPGFLCTTLEQALSCSMAANQIVAFAAVAVLGFASATLGYKSRQADPDELYGLFQRYELMLWSTSTSLVLVILHIHFLFAWPVEVLGPPPTGGADAAARVGVAAPAAQAAALARFAQAAALGAGLIFSGFAAAIFLPVGLIQNRRLQELLEQAKKADGFDREAWLRLHGFGDTTPFAFFLKHSAILIPVVTGLLTRLLDTAPK
jgi:hypothetical protein